MFWQQQYGCNADLYRPVLHHWTEGNMTWLLFGSLMYYVAAMGMWCESVNGQGCSVGDDASKRHKWLYFVICNSWIKSLKHQRRVLSVWPWDKSDCKVHPAKKNKKNKQKKQSASPFWSSVKPFLLSYIAVNWDLSILDFCSEKKTRHLKFFFTYFQMFSKQITNYSIKNV